jgi:hypothetical protein
MDFTPSKVWVTPSKPPNSLENLKEGKLLPHSLHYHLGDFRLSIDRWKIVFCALFM